METKIINGQPQISPTFGNRIVTYDGLVDFLEMLKKEIPKMGKNNYFGTPQDYSYLFGEENDSGARYSFAVGKKNILGYSSYGYLFGEENISNGGSFVFLAGKKNKINNSVQYSFAFGEGNQINMLGNGKVSEAYLLGYNNRIDNTNAVYLFGHNLQNPDNLSNRTKPTMVLGQSNEQITNANADAFPALIIGNGTTDARSNLLVLKYDGGIDLKNGHFLKSVSFKDNLILSNNTKVEDQTTTSNEGEYVYQCGGLRPVFTPFRGNEMVWSVFKEYNHVKVPSLHINFRSYELPDNDSSAPPANTQWVAPKNIWFHAGEGENSFANIFCGDLHAHSSLTVGGFFSGTRGVTFSKHFTCEDGPRYVEVALEDFDHKDILAAIVIQKTDSETTDIATGVCFIPDTDGTNYIFDGEFVRVTTTKENGVLTLRCEPYSLTHNALIPDYWPQDSQFDITLTPLMKLS